jgi:hypothetical protein
MVLTEQNKTALMGRPRVAIGQEQDVDSKPDIRVGGPPVAGEERLAVVRCQGDTRYG